MTPPPVTDPGAADVAVAPARVAGPAGRARAGLLFVIAGAIAVVAVAVLFIFFPRSNPSVNPRGEASSTEVHRPVPAAPSRPPQAAEVVSAPVIASPPEAPHPTKRRIEPEKAESPAAPGRARSHAPKVVARPLPSDTVADTPADSKSEPQVAPAAPPAEDFGMSLPRPMNRRPFRKIDETDPYAP